MRHNGNNDMVGSTRIFFHIPDDDPDKRRVSNIGSDDPGGAQVVSQGVHSNDVVVEVID